MEDRCVMCGAIIPEGRQVCPACEAGYTPVINKNALLQRLVDYMYDNNVRADVKIEDLAEGILELSD